MNNTLKTAILSETSRLSLAIDEQRNTNDNAELDTLREQATSAGEGLLVSRIDATTNAFSEWVNANVRLELAEDCDEEEQDDAAEEEDNARDDALTAIRQLRELAAKDAA